MIGKSIRPHDALEKATGRTIFATDVKLPGMLYGKLKRSPIPHGKIVKIDLEKAKRLPGVKAIVTAEDAPRVRFGFFLKDRTLFCHDEVRYIGEAVAGVAATEERIAEEAVELIHVEYEPLPSVFDPLEAVKEEAPRVHKDLETYQAVWPARKYGNVCSHLTYESGDPERGFAESDVILENTFRTPIVHQGYLEPHVALADIGPQGEAIFWTSVQVPDIFHSLMAWLLSLPMSKVRVIAPPIGGSFGAKVENLCAAYAFLLAKKARRSVKLTWTREEEFIDGHPRHSAIIIMKLGAKKDGTLMAMKAEMFYDAGAYAEFGPGLMENGAQVVRGPYRIPHVRIDGYCVYTNKTVTGAYRGYGCPQPVVAVESQMDALAEKLCMDPLDIRLKNAIEDGDQDITGTTLYGVAVKEVLKEVASASKWKERNTEKGRALGIACGYFGHGSGGPSSALVWLYPDGTVHLSVNSPNVAGSHTSLLQIVSEELKVPMEEISIVSGDTHFITYEKGPISDRTIYCTGNAVKEAAVDIRNQLLHHASRFLEARVEDLALDEKHVFVKWFPQKRVPFPMLIKQYGSLIGRGVFHNVPPQFDLGQGTGLERHTSYEYVAQVADVKVDGKTGHVDILKIYAAHNCGKAINPMLVEGQIEGSVQQGVGYALSEEMVFEDGEVMNPSYLHYKLPMSLDVPEVISAIVEKPDPRGPYGAKGAGQGSIVVTAPAIANAIARAIGVRFTELPVTPRKIVEKMAENHNP